MAHGFTSETRAFELQHYGTEPTGEADENVDTGAFYTNGVLVGSRVYCVGSLRKPSYLPPFINLCKFDLNSNTYSACHNPDDLACGRAVSLCLTGDALYTYGGAIEIVGGREIVGLLKFDLVLEEWIHVTSEVRPVVRAMCCGALVDQTRFVIFGGYREGVYFNDTWVFHIDRRSWKEAKVQGQRPRARWAHEACVSDDFGTGEQTIYVFGGHNASALNDLYLLHCTREKYRWSQPDVTGNIPSRMTGHRMMYFDGKILLCGGSGTDFFNVYDIHSRRWTRPQARVGTTLRSVASAQFGREGAVDEYLVYGQHLLLRSTISEHAAIPCSKGLLILFGSSRSSALLVPR